MEKYGFVYIWYDRYRKMFYIGSHWGTENDGYVCSSNRMRDAYRRRPHDFKRRIIAKVVNSKQLLLEKEYYYLSMINSDELGKKYYNLTNHMNGHWFTDEERKLNLSEKISARTKEAMQKPEVREKYLEGLKTRNNRSSDIDVREKRRVSMIGKNVGKDNSKAVAISAKMRVGVPLTEEHKQKIKNAGTFSLINNKKVSCIHCGFIGNPGNIGRYHNDKCKRKG